MNDPRPFCIRCGERWLPDEGVDATAVPCQFCAPITPADFIPRPPEPGELRAALEAIVKDWRREVDNHEGLAERIYQTCAEELEGVIQTMSSHMAVEAGTGTDQPGSKSGSNPPEDAKEPGKSAKGGGVTHQSARNSIPSEALWRNPPAIKRLHAYVDQQEAAESQRAHLEEAAEILRFHPLSQYDTERHRDWLERDKASPTRSARAEARSDGEGQAESAMQAQERMLAAAHHGPLAQPPQPGGFGPTEALRAELVAALRETYDEQYPMTNQTGPYALKLLADRLERTGKVQR